MSLVIRIPSTLTDLPANAGQSGRALIRASETIVMLGDSLTSTDWLYWQALKDYADDFYSAHGPTWLNSGVSGAGMVNFFNVGTNYQTYCTSLSPTAMICEVGVNDAAGVGFDAPTFQAAYTTFLANCFAGAPGLSASQVILCSPWLFQGDPTGPKETELDQATTAVSAVASAFGCRYVDFRTGRPTDGNYVVDGTHPSAKGKVYLCGKVRQRMVFL